MTDWTPCPEVNDDNGYPSDAELETIKTWPIAREEDVTAALAYVQERWIWPPPYFTRESRRFREWKSGPLVRRYLVSTGGWSGHESLLAAMEENWMLWTMTWYSVRRGGHYEFRVKENEKRA